MKTQMELPTRDEDRRKLFGDLLSLSKKERNKFTVQELEALCLKRGYLEVA